MKTIREMNEKTPFWNATMVKCVLYLLHTIVHSTAIGCFDLHFCCYCFGTEKKLNIHWKSSHEERKRCKIVRKMCTIQPINAHKMSFSVLNLLLQRMIYGRCLRVKTTYAMEVAMRTHIKWQVREVHYCCVVRARCAFCDMHETPDKVNQQKRRFSIDMC